MIANVKIQTVKYPLPINKDMKINIVCLIFFLITFLPYSCNNQKLFFEVRNIIYPRAYDIEKFENPKDKIYALNYKVNETYPSQEVIEFYDQRLQKLKFFPYIDPNTGLGHREWRYYFDDTIEGSPLIFTTEALWVDKRKTVMLILVLTYYDYFYEQNSEYKKDYPKSDVQNVTFQVVPFQEFPEDLKQ